MSRVAGWYAASAAGLPRGARFRRLTATRCVRAPETACATHLVEKRVVRLHGVPRRARFRCVRPVGSGAGTRNRVTTWPQVLAVRVGCGRRRRVEPPGTSSRLQARHRAGTRRRRVPGDARRGGCVWPRCAAAPPLTPGTAATRAAAGEILRDLGRTFPKHPLFRDADGALASFPPPGPRTALPDQTPPPLLRSPGAGQSLLANVLRACARRHPEVGYCQGMNYVAALCLMVSLECDVERSMRLRTVQRAHAMLAKAEEAHVFALMRQLVQRYGMRELWRPGVYRVPARLRPRCSASLCRAARSRNRRAPAQAARVSVLPPPPPPPSPPRTPL